MKYLLFTLSLVFGLVFSAMAQSKTVQAGSSQVDFVIQNFGLDVEGSFGGMQGKVIWYPEDLDQSIFDVTLDASTVDTDNKKRDESLKKPEYFSVDAHPTIRITSSTISKTEDGFTMEGKLRIKDVEKTISIPFTVDQEGGELVIKGSFEIDRLNYNVGEDSWVLGDEVVINITCTAH